MPSDGRSQAAVSMKIKSKRDESGDLDGRSIPLYGVYTLAGWRLASEIVNAAEVSDNSMAVVGAGALFFGSVVSSLNFAWDLLEGSAAFNVGSDVAASLFTIAVSAAAETKTAQMAQLLLAGYGVARAADAALKVVSKGFSAYCSRQSRLKRETDENFVRSELREHERSGVKLSIASQQVKGAVVSYKLGLCFSGRQARAINDLRHCMAVRFAGPTSIVKLLDSKRDAVGEVVVECEPDDLRLAVAQYKDVLNAYDVYMATQKILNKLARSKVFAAVERFLPCERVTGVDFTMQPHRLQCQQALSEVEWGIIDGIASREDFDVASMELRVATLQLGQRIALSARISKATRERVKDIQLQRQTAIDATYVPRHEADRSKGVALTQYPSAEGGAAKPDRQDVSDAPAAEDEPRKFPKKIEVTRNGEELVAVLLAGLREGNPKPVYLACLAAARKQLSSEQEAKLDEIMEDPGSVNDASYQFLKTTGRLKKYSRDFVKKYGFAPCMKLRFRGTSEDRKLGGDGREIDVDICGKADLVTLTALGPKH